MAKYTIIISFLSKADNMDYIVESGNLWNNTIIDNYDTVSILNGGTANNTTVDDGRLNVCSGGTANSIIVNYGGNMFVSSGGTANDTTVNDHGTLIVSQGGTATNIVENGGYVGVDDNAYVTFVPNTFSGLVLEWETIATVHSGTTANSTTVKTYGLLNICGGTANDTTVSFYGSMSVSSGGMANSTTVNSCGELLIEDGGIADSTTVNSCGSMYVSSGGTATNIVWTPCEGHVFIDTGASATFVSAYSGVYYGSDNLLLSNTVMMNSVTLDSSQEMNVMSGGTADSTVVNNGGSMHVSSGGTAANTTVSGGDMYVTSGGTATNIVWTPCEGHIYIFDGAFTTFASTYSGVYCGSNNHLLHNSVVMEAATLGRSQEMIVMSGGTANDTIVNQWASMFVSSGGTANSTTIRDGWLYVSNGGTVNSTTVYGGDPGGTMYVFSGGIAEKTVISGGIMNVCGGATANNIDLDGGIINVTGGTVIDITDSVGVINICDGGFIGDILLKGGQYSRYVNGEKVTNWWMPVINVSNGGMAAGIKGWDGKIKVSSGGVVSGVEIGATYYDVTHTSGSGYYSITDTGDNVTTSWVDNPGIHLSSGAKLTGQMTFSSGAKVYAESGSILDFDLTQTTAGGSALVSDLSAIEGIPTYTLTVGGTQENGTYRLADGLVAGTVFDQTITVRNTTGDQLGVLTAGQSLVLGDSEYLLSVADGGLSLTVTQVVAPDKPIISVDLTTPTTGTVTVTAEFSGNSVSRQYSLDGETWKDYTGGILFTENGIVSFRSINIMGTFSEVATYEVTNIDRTPPEKPVPGADVTAPTNADVFVTAAFSRDSVVREYSLDGENWCPYPGGIMFTSNRKAYFRAFDAAGNVSEVAEYQVTNIDRTAPESPVISVDAADPSGQSVSVSAAFSGDSAVCEYSFDGKDWLAYTDPILCVGNETVLFRGTDAAGNVSEVVCYAAELNDTVAPTDPTGLDAIVSGRKVALVWNAATDISSGVKEYVVNCSSNGREFTVRTNNTNYVLTGADFGSYTWSVQALDCAGNESAVVAGKAFTVTTAQEPVPEQEEGFVAKGDIDGNGTSDVMFQWTGGNDQIGFWMNGHTQWQSQGRTHSPDWTVLGTHDMNADGKADIVMLGQASINDMRGTYIGYYSEGVDTDANWHTIGFLLDQGPTSSVKWINAVGNLTGNANANSIVWYSQDLYALGTWIDGKEQWESLSGSFGGPEWTLVGCGDFDGDGRDSVVMSYNNGQFFYTAGIGEDPGSLGGSDWSNGWEARAIGDFAGDGKDDIVLFHKEFGVMVMLVDGNADNYEVMGQLAANDWFVVGAGDYNGDQKDDLLVRQHSSGMLGYYISGDITQWNTIGYGVDLNWTVIA